MKYPLLLALLLPSAIAFTQVSTIQMNYERLQFDDGKPLPAETSFFLTGALLPETHFIELSIYQGNPEKSRELYATQWKKNAITQSNNFLLPVQYKLRPGQEYSFQFAYFREISEMERTQVKTLLLNNISGYLISNVQRQGNRYQLKSRPAYLFTILNEQIDQGLAAYRSTTGRSPDTFSSITENMLYNLTRYRFSTDSVIKEDPLNNLLNQIDNELTLMLNEYQFIQNDQLLIANYPVEKKQSSLALNIGYAGIYNEGDFDDLNYYSGAYAGLSFPLGSSTFSGRFWNNTSVSMGVFLRNFTSSTGNKISGPVTGLPIYAGLGYRVFKYFRINAGAAVLEENFQGPTPSKSVYLKPYVGLSLEVNLWLGLDKK